MARKFKTATAAGTFDSFHKGHEHFLTEAFNLADTIYIAITSDAFAKQSRLHEEVSSFDDRKKHVGVFLKKHTLLSRSKFIELDDIYGPTLKPDCPIEAIIVTGNTLYGAELINKLRAKKRLPPLTIERIPYLKAVDGGDLSSSRIRGGEIDREGRPFLNKEWLDRNLRLPVELRPILRKSIGELIRGSESDLSRAVSTVKKRIGKKMPILIITVGDVVAKSFNEGELTMNIAIVDYHVKRVATFKNLAEIRFKKKEPDIVAENPKGTLTGELLKAVKTTFLSLRGAKRRSNPQRDRHTPSELAMTTPYIIRVIGEEDLATLAVILAAPLNTHVFYGQPNEGIVQVVVTEEKKAEIRDIVSQFD